MMQPPIDPLKRVFVYNGDRFVTSDGERYVRTTGDTIQHFDQKINGKQARKARARARKHR